MTTPFAMQRLRDLETVLETLEPAQGRCHVSPGRGWGNLALVCEGNMTHSGVAQWPEDPVDAP
jgi:hypothetical protein